MSETLCSGDTSQPRRPYLADKRPCRGDCYHVVAVGPALIPRYACDDCRQHVSNQGKCLGERGYGLLRAARS